MKPEEAANDPLLKDLNDRQLEAVTTEDESTIILAGAGSGKTKVLTIRAAYLIREARMTDEDLLMVTFTNKAAKEMKTRLSKLLNRSASKMWIGTFHGLSNRMLRENYVEAGLPSTFTIMDGDDQLAMCKRLLKEMPTSVSAPDGKDLVKELLGFINRNKEVGLRADHCSHHTDFEDFAVEFYQAYEMRCVREGVVDFAELLLRVSELLETNENFLAQYRDRFSHIQVDEFQDTNSVQYKFLRALKGDRASIFAVGDDDQSIYAFRGSDPQHMQDFVAEIPKDRVIRLEQNYRSTGAILDAANSLIEKNSARLGKNLWTDAGSGNRIKIAAFKNEYDEAEHVAKTLKDSIAAGTPPSEMAILYRSNHQARGYEKALMAHGVPYVIYGGTKFYERMEVKNALAYMRLTTNMEDNGAFMRVVNFPSRGIGDRTLDQVAEIARQHEVATGNPMSLLEAAATLYQGPQKNIDKFVDFVTLLSGLFNAVTEMPLPQFVEHLIGATGLIEVYDAKKDEKEQARSETLREMVGAATRFCEESDVPNAMTIPAIEMLGEFLTTATLESAADSKDGERKAEVQDIGSVTLMTVHASKGLEFDHVIIGGADEGVFPLARSVDADGDEEERRLMYVAITRSRRDLMMTTRDEATIHGKKVDLSPSRFVYEIGEEFKSHITPAVSRQYTGPQTQKKWPEKTWATKSGTGAAGSLTDDPDDDFVEADQASSSKARRARP